jgi:hypothetical protein
MKQMKGNLIQYLKYRYDVKLDPRDENQPLLVVHYKDQKSYLPPSLCFEASLPKDFTKDFRKMK